MLTKTGGISEGGAEHQKGEGEGTGPRGVCQVH